jgi:transposase InsO family protein
MKTTLADALLLERIRAIKADHPFWGYRRVWAYLKYREEMPVNRKRIYRLMSENRLLVAKNLRLKARRTEGRPKPRASRPRELFGIDMTKVMVDGVGWRYLVIMLDWYTKRIVAWGLSDRSRSKEWQGVVEQAVNELFPNGVRDAEGVKLVSDNGCQPTSERFMAACRTLGMEQVFTSYNNPRGNADTERVIRTMKEDLIWLREWRDPQELLVEIGKWVERYNTDYPHSALRYRTPYEFERDFFESITKVPA